MADRSVTVALKLSDVNFSSGLLAAAAKAKAFAAALENTTGRGSDLDTALGDAGTSASSLGKSLQGTHKQLDLFDNEIGDTYAQLSLFGDSAHDAADAFERLENGMQPTVEATRNFGLRIRESQVGLGSLSRGLDDASDSLSEYTEQQLALALAENNAAAARVKQEQALIRLTRAENAHSLALGGGDEHERFIDLEAAQVGAERSILNLVAAEHKLLDVQHQVDDAFGDEGGSGGLGGFVRQLDTGNDRMTNLIQTSVALGPALIPTLAAATPLLAGVVAGLTFATVGAGVTAMAFSGVGETLKAVNDYALEPSATNLTNMRVAMEKMGPAGQDFVMFLQGIRPEMQNLQNLAQEGMLPGFQEGIEQVMTQMPLLEGIIQNVSGAIGDMAAEGGAALTNPFWTDFFSYIRDDARVILTDLGSAMGHLTEGLAALLIDFGPMSQSFMSGFDNMARSFSGWAQNLPDTQGFQDFLNYIRDVTPDVKAALGSIGSAFVDLVQAAAPVGGASLQVIETFMKGLSVVLDSPIGAPLIAVAAGISAFSRAVSLFNIVAGGAMAKSLGALSLAVGGPGFISGFKVAAAGVALFALSLTDLDEKAGLTNTLSLAAAGAVFGGFGAVVGAAAGAVMDAAKANDAFVDSYDHFNSVMTSQPTDFQAQRDALSGLSDEFENLQDTLSVGGDSNSILGMQKNWVEGLFGDSDVEEAAADLEAAAKRFQTAKDVFSQVGNAMSPGSGIVDYTTDLKALEEIALAAAPAMEHFGISIQDLENADAATFTAYMDSFRRFNAEADSMAGRSQAVVGAIGELDNQIFQTAASADTLAAALEGLMGPEAGAIEAADAWTTGLRELESQMNANNKTLVGNSEAAIQNRGAMLGMKDLLTGNLTAMANAGAGSDQLARSLASQRQAWIQTAVDAGASRKEVVGFVNSLGLTPKLVTTVLKAQGITEAENAARNLADSYNRLPKEVRTKIAAEGGDVTANQIREIGKQAGLTPKQIRIAIQANDDASVKIKGVRAEAKALEGAKPRVQLSADAGQALNAIQGVMRQITGLDRQHPNPKLDADQGPATSSINAVESQMRQYAGQHPNPRLDADEGPALGSINAVESQMNQYDGSSATGRLEAQNNASGPISAARAAALAYATTYTATLVTNVVRNIIPGKPNADGGVIRGPGGPRDDLIPIMASNGEFVVNARATARNLSLLHEINAQKFAAGGQVQHLAKGGQPAFVNQLDKFDPRKGTKSEVSSAISAMLDGLKEILGPHSRFIDRVSKLGKSIVDLTKKQDKVVNTLERQIDSQEALRKKQDEYADSVASNFQQAMFEQGMTLKDALLQGRADANDAEAFQRGLKQAEKAGLSGGTYRDLAESGNLSLLKELLAGGGDHKAIKQLENVFTKQQRASAAVGRTAGREVFSERLQDNARELHHTRQELHHLNKRLHNLDQRITGAVRDGAREGSRKGSHEGTSSGRRARGRFNAAQGRR